MLRHPQIQPTDRRVLVGGSCEMEQEEEESSYEEEEEEEEESSCE